MICKYIRLTSINQPENIQTLIIDGYLYRMGLVADKIVRDKTSLVSEKYDQAVLIKLCNTLHRSDIIVISEASVMTRSSISEIYEIIEAYFKPNGLRLIICNVGLDIDFSTDNITAGIQLDTLSIISKIEKTIIKERTKAIIDAIKVGKVAVDNNITKTSNETTRLNKEKSHKALLSNENNIKFYKYILEFEERNGSFKINKGNNQQKWEQLANELNQLGYKTSSGMDFNAPRCRNMYKNVMKSVADCNLLIDSEIQDDDFVQHQID